jgi:hypothetical protein
MLLWQLLQFSRLSRRPPSVAILGDISPVAARSIRAVGALAIRNKNYVRVLGDGKETTVFIVNIDSGWDEWVDGKWRERVTSSSASPDL